MYVTPFSMFITANCQNLTDNIHTSLILIRLGLNFPEVCFLHFNNYVSITPPERSYKISSSYSVHWFLFVIFFSEIVVDVF